MRKLAAMLILLAYLVFCIFFFATMGTWMTHLHGFWQLIFYILAGVIWIAPLKPLFAWMNSGPQPEE